MAPQLWPIEALNSLLAAERRGRLDAAARHRRARFLRDLPIRGDDETAGRLWNDTARLAEQHGLTAYDAAYLELALRLSVPLATADRALIGAARKAGGQVLPAIA